MKTGSETEQAAAKTDETGPEGVKQWIKRKWTVPTLRHRHRLLPHHPPIRPPEKPQKDAENAGPGQNLMNGDVLAQEAGRRGPAPGV